MKIKTSFSNLNSRRVCQKCGCLLKRNKKGDLCPACQDKELYRQVKEFILHNDVTEVQVADQFDIPLSKVREWIREGYIEYRRNSW